MSRRDPVQERVQSLVRELVAIGYPRTPFLVRVCECGHEDGTHFGVDGELACADCPCPAFVPSSELEAA